MEPYRNTLDESLHGVLVSLIGANHLGYVFSTLGLGLLLYRLGPSALWAIRARSGEMKASRAVPDSGLVSIIVPARNEEANLPNLIASLAQLQYRNFEVIIVDDASTDNTAAIVRMAAERDERIKLLSAGEKPAGWVGKTWACEQGGKAARGVWLLFTDADTLHFPSGLAAAINQMRRGKVDLLSALPNHVEGMPLDPFLGPFHLLVFLSSSAFSPQAQNRLFAIGQYLLFRSDYYRRQGGHSVVKGSFAEDLDLAERCFKLRGHYVLDRSGELFGVRMYTSINDFIAGWRRIFRQGFARAQGLVVVEIFLVIACLMMSFRFARASSYETALALVGCAVVGLAQKRYGQFSWLGVLMIPFSVALFTIISALALFDRISGRDLRWRGRTYKIKP